MIKIEFTEEDKRALNYERYHHPHPRVQIFITTVWLKSLNYSQENICEIANISKSTYYNYLNEYVKGGIEKIKEVNFYQPQSDLVELNETLENYFREHPPTCVKEAVDKIEELTNGIKRSETQIRKLLKKMGMKCLKVGMIPSKAEPDKQEMFKKTKSRTGP